MTEKKKTKELEAIEEIVRYLDEKVIGQDRAIRRIRKALFNVMAGINNANRPLGIFFFAGPSRTGKTLAAAALSEALAPLRREKFTAAYIPKLEELKQRFIKTKTDAEKINGKNANNSNLIIGLNKQIAGIEEDIKKLKKYQNKNGVDRQTEEDFNRYSPGLVRVDCGTLSFDEWSVSSLTSSPPGLVGSNKPGLLDPNVINDNWGCVILFDEIEKAHPAIYNLLLQIFDYGKLPLANARGTVDFTQSIIILTSNIGGREMEMVAKGKGKIGFKTGKEKGSKEVLKKSDRAYDICKEEYGRKFSREFRNRVDEFIAFNYLDAEAMKKIIKIELQKVQQTVNEKNLGFAIKYDDSVVDAFYKKLGHFEEQAAGIINLIKKEIRTPLSEMIVSGELAAADILEIRADADGKLRFSVNKPPIDGKKD